MGSNASLIVVFTAGTLLAQLPSTPGWFQIPNTALKPVDACFNGFSYACGNTTGGIFAWSGGIFDTLRNRVLVFGGGHTDYRGNEIYAMDLDDRTMTRITVPGSPTASGCQEAIANGTQPNSRHTYDGICYMENIDRMFVFGGSLACGPGNGGRDTWTFDFKTMTWHRMNPTGTIPGAVMGITCDYDPVSGKVFINDRSYLYIYDFAADSYTRLDGSYRYGLNYYHVSVIDPKRKKYLMIGNGEAFIVDIAQGSSYQCQNFTSTGGSAVVAEAYPGLAYDPDRDRVVAWIGGDVVYSLDMDARVWTTTTYSGGPGSSNGTGTYKRWGHSRKDHRFALVNRYDQNAYTFKFPGTTAEGTAPRPNANPVSGMVTIFDAAGSRIARVPASEWGFWSGRVAGGGMVRAGIYFARWLDGPARRVERKVVLK